MTILILIVIAIILFSVNKFMKQDKAKEEYLKLLKRLKNDPNNPDLREETLRSGRCYSELMRDSSGRTIFDEVALMNDINAACARATTGQNTVAKVEIANSGGFVNKSVAQEIEKLGQLFLKGVITAEEFERGKSLFLGSAPDKAASTVELLQNLDMLRKKGVLSESEFNTKKWEILGRLK